MTRDELVALVGGELVGGNVVAKNVCYGRVTEGVFVLTPEGEAAVLAAATPAAAPKKRAPKAPKAPAPGADGSSEDLDDVGDDLDLE